MSYKLNILYNLEAICCRVETNIINQKYILIYFTANLQLSCLTLQLNFSKILSKIAKFK